jgi:trehalose 6-phosphate phosphatase
VVLMALCYIQVFNFVKLAELYYAGSHGMDIKGPTARCRHTKAKHLTCMGKIVFG